VVDRDLCVAERKIATTGRTHCVVLGSVGDVHNLPIIKYGSR